MLPIALTLLIVGTILLILFLLTMAKITSSWLPLAALLSGAAFVIAGGFLAIAIMIIRFVSML